VRRALPFLVLAALFSLGTGSATSQSGIVIRAASSGSHLRLTVSDSHLLVDGRLADDTQPVGCSPTRGYGGASCQLADASSIVVEAGPSNDKVEVLDPLPVPLTVYLGSGSDKLIGNAEPDTCHAEGSARNRCIGEAGDDICIAGPVNTDCVGGAGDDYCKTASGSDGCWGGPGDDICLMGAGSDGCHGEAGDDRLYGGLGGDQLYGGAGFDYCDGGPGDGQSHGCESGPRR
jgi:Ca2+-binding RTX toxin-like protein